MNKNELMQDILHIESETVKQFVETLKNEIGYIELMGNRTGVMTTPYTNTVKEDSFILKDQLVSEAFVRINGTIGYGAVIGRDLAHATAIATLNCLLLSDQFVTKIEQFSVSFLQADVATI